MARGRRGISIRNIAPLGTGAQDPQDAVQNSAVVLPRAASSVSTTRRPWDQWFENAPLFVREVHRSSLSAFHDAVEKQLTSRQPFMRQLLAMDHPTRGSFFATAEMDSSWQLRKYAQGPAAIATYMFSA